MAPGDNSNRAPWIASASPYSHDPINSQAEIRIMELLPPTAPTPDSLFCTLITAKLSDKPLYEALSYAWGAEIFPERLHLPTGYLSITSNLAAALRQLRNVDRPRRLWVDAVCINQHDNVEKQHQVPLMSSIFGNTKCALAWLGPGSRQTRYAINIFRELANSAWRYDIQDKDTLQIIPNRNVSEIVKHALRDLSSRLDYVALRAFFQQEWFGRLWIVQEVALPPRLNFYNGQEILEFGIFSKGCHVIGLMFIRGMLSNTTPDMLSMQVELSQQSTVIMHREYMQSSDKSYTDRRTTLLYLVNNMEARSCKRDVDRIYALLGLQVLQDDITLDVNYERSVEDIYEDFAFKYLQKNEIGILYKAGERRQASVVWDKKDPKSKLACKLPTWAPDWRYKPAMPGIGSSKSYRAATDVSPSFLLGEDILPFVGVIGFLTDIVKTEISTFFPTLQTLPSMKHIWKDWPEGIIKLKDLCSYFHKEEPYPTGEDMDTAFARTVVMDRRDSFVKIYLPNLISPQDFRSIWFELKKGFEKSRVLPDDRETETYEHYSTAKGVTIYQEMGRLCGRMRNFFITESGYIGLGPWDLEPGDAVVIFDGASVPFVLRRVQQNDVFKQRGESNLRSRVASEEQWEIVGDCYLHGFMDNEILESKYADKKQTFWIT